MRFELATRTVTSPDSENFAPLELQDSLTWKILVLPYQKYTFSERKFHEDFKYVIKYNIGSGTKILWLKIFGFWGPQKWIFARSISHSPINLSGSCGNPSTDSARVWAAAKPTWVNGAMLIQQIQPVNAGPQSRPCSTYWDAHFSKMNAAWKIWQLLMKRLSTVQEPGQTYD